MAVGLYEWAVIVDHKPVAFLVGQNIDAYWDWLTQYQSLSQYRTSSSEVWINQFYGNPIWFEQSYANKFDSVQEYFAVSVTVIR